MHWSILTKFKNQFHLARKAASGMSQSDIGFKMHYEKDKDLSFLLNLPPEKEIARFATMMRPLANPESPLYFKKIITIIRENNLGNMPDIDNKELQKFVKSIENGFMRLSVNNNKNMSVSDLYKTYGNGEYFSDSAPERSKMADLKKHPVAFKMILYSFFSYSYDVYKICCYLYELIRSAEKKRTTAKILNKKKMQCIYCLCKNEEFNHVEHVYPESLGNTEIILPQGYVCDKCNNDFSKLDEHLVNNDAISFLRTIYLPYNPKTGKFIKARFQNMTIEKTQPRKIFFDIHANSKKYFDVNTIEGISHIRINTIGRTKFNPQLLGRALYKIALGIICWENGVNVALDSRYDMARKFILGQSVFPNNLIIGSECTPCETIEGMHFIGDTGTIFEIKIFGLPFLFNIEPEPIIQINPELEKLKATIFSLSD